MLYNITRFAHYYQKEGLKELVPTIRARFLELLNFLVITLCLPLNILRTSFSLKGHSVQNKVNYYVKPSRDLITNKLALNSLQKAGSEGSVQKLDHSNKKVRNL